MYCDYFTVTLLSIMVTLLLLYHGSHSFCIVAALLSLSWFSFLYYDYPVTLLSIMLTLLLLYHGSVSFCIMITLLCYCIVVLLLRLEFTIVHS